MLTIYEAPTRTRVVPSPYPSRTRSASWMGSQVRSADSCQVNCSKRPLSLWSPLYYTILGDDVEWSSNKIDLSLFSLSCLAVDALRFGLESALSVRRQMFK